MGKWSKFCLCWWTLTAPELHDQRGPLKTEILPNLIRNVSSVSLRNVVGRIGNAHEQGGGAANLGNVVDTRSSAPVSGGGVFGEDLFHESI